jgi:hypothetical protein
MTGPDQDEEEDIVHGEGESTAGGAMSWCCVGGPSSLF